MRADPLSDGRSPLDVEHTPSAARTVRGPAGRSCADRRPRSVCLHGRRRRTARPPPTAPAPTRRRRRDHRAPSTRRAAAVRAADAGRVRAPASAAGRRSAAAADLVRQPGPAAARPVPLPLRPGQPGPRRRRLLGQRRRVLMQLDGYDAAPVVTPGPVPLRARARRPGRMLLASVDRPPPGSARTRCSRSRGTSARSRCAPAPACSASSTPAASATRRRAARPRSRPAIGDVSAVGALRLVAHGGRLRALGPDVPGQPRGRARRRPRRPRRGRSRSRRGPTRPPASCSTPRMLDRPGPERDRLVRHELTHVAVGGARRRRAGVAVRGTRRVGVGPAARARRTARLPTPRGRRRRGRGSTDLPDDDTFNDDDSRAHYGLAWWACEYVADSYGDDAPWLLLDALDGRRPGADPRPGAARRSSALDAPRALADAGRPADPARRYALRRRAARRSRARPEGHCGWHERLPHQVDRAVHRGHRRARAPAEEEPRRPRPHGLRRRASSSAPASSC